MCLRYSFWIFCHSAVSSLRTDSWELGSTDSPCFETSMLKQNHRTLWVRLCGRAGRWMLPTKAQMIAKDWSLTCKIFCHQAWHFWLVWMIFVVHNARNLYIVTVFKPIAMTRSPMNLPYVLSAGGNANAKTPEESKTRTRVPRPCGSQDWKGQKGRNLFRRSCREGASMSIWSISNHIICVYIYSYIFSSCVSLMHFIAEVFGNWNGRGGEVEDRDIDMSRLSTASEHFMPSPCHSSINVMSSGDLLCNRKWHEEPLEGQLSTGPHLHSFDTDNSGNLGICWQDEMNSPDYSERRISLDMTPLSCKSTGSSAECAHCLSGWVLGLSKASIG